MLSIWYLSISGRRRRHHHELGTEYIHCRVLEVDGQFFELRDGLASFGYASALVPFSLVATFNG